MEFAVVLIRSTEKEGPGSMRKLSANGKILLWEITGRRAHCRIKILYP